MGRNSISLEDLAGKYGIKPQENYDNHNKKPSNKNNFGNKNFNQRNDRKINFNSDEKATAPYNFVSLPDKPLTSPMEENHFELLKNKDRKSRQAAREAFRKYIEGHEQISGEILLDIQALTPLFIGGNPSNSENSFAPLDNNFPILPGSSLRGMFKNIFKIVTCGTMRGVTDSLKKGEDINDEHIYFRCLMTTKSSPAWMDDLNKLYNSRMTNNARGKDGKMHPVKNAKPGFLVKVKSGKFYIVPSIYKSDRKEDRILIKEYEQKFNDVVKIRNDSRVTWHDRTAYIITGSQSPNRLYDKKSYERLPKEQLKKIGKQFIRFTKIDYVDWSRDHWVELSDEVRLSYEHDRNRRGVNLFKDQGILNRDKLKTMVKNLPDDVVSLIPCHFLQEDGQVTAFGHGQCFRIPYRSSIADLVPKNLNSDVIDFSDAIFGRESFWASRVFFEDAKPVKQAEFQEKAAAHPLMQPNPTSYQLYLTQEKNKKLNHWDSDDAQIRGYKMYWHNGSADWKASPEEKALDAGKTPDKRLTKDLTPLKKGNLFTSKIRFSNLSKIELGALLMIFDLDGKSEQAAYKIGQGKSFGFGSIRVKPTLYIENDDIYDELFDGDGWKNPYHAEDMKEYLDEFKKYIKSENMQTTWQNVMNELNAILNFEQTKQKGWSDKIKSMSGNVQSKTVDDRFKNRAPLPNIFEVVNNA